MVTLEALFRNTRLYDRLDNAYLLYTCVAKHDGKQGHAGNNLNELQVKSCKMQ